MNMPSVKISKLKEIVSYPYRDLNWRSYFCESDSKYVLREFRNPFQGSYNFYRNKFIEEHVAMLILAEFKLAPEGELFVSGDSVVYRHKHLVLFQMNPGEEIIEEIRSNLESAGFILPPELAYTRFGIDPYDNNVKIFRIDDLITAHLPVEELLIKIQSKVHGLELDEYILMNPMIKTAEDYPKVLTNVANTDWIGWAKTHLEEFLDIATTDLYLQESKNIPLLQRILKTGGAKLKIKK
jgi:hypothetical protein